MHTEREREREKGKERKGKKLFNDEAGEIMGTTRQKRLRDIGQFYC
jgi:hypothetical protein